MISSYLKIWETRDTQANVVNIYVCIRVWEILSIHYYYYYYLKNTRVYVEVLVLVWISAASSCCDHPGIALLLPTWKQTSTLLSYLLVILKNVKKFTCWPEPDPYLTSCECRRAFELTFISFTVDVHVTYSYSMIAKCNFLLLLPEKF